MSCMPLLSLVIISPMRQRAGQLSISGLLLPAGRDKKAAAVQRNYERPSPGMLNSDPAVLEAELVRTFGATTVLPTRAQLREANR